MTESVTRCHPCETCPRMSLAGSRDPVEILKEYFRSLEGVAVAFSGGVDSAVLAYIANKVLGDRMVAVTGVSPSVPSRDMESAISFCRQHGIPHLTVETNEFKDGDYVKNPDNRCFYCKGSLFSAIEKVAREKGFKFVIEGTNASELAGHRPGFQVARQNPNVRTPYVDLGFTKDDVRALARELKLELADRPSTACLASRIPTGVKIEADILRRIDDAENFLISLGLKQVRVRYHGEVARLETDDAGMKICLERRQEIVSKIKALGWKNVTLDLLGYRTGGGR